MSAQARKQLRQLLDAAPSTAEFLEDVQRAIESLYAETDGECPEGFGALDKAIEAFEDYEGEDLGEDDDDEEDDDDDEEG